MQKKDITIPQKFIIVIIALPLVMGVGVFRDFARQPPTDVIAYINSEPVVRKEFKEWISLNRSAVYMYFYRKYGIEDNPDFWLSDTCYQGESPTAIIKERALNDLISIKVQMLLAKRKNLIDDISYATLMANRSKENQRRKEAVVRKQVIYGPIEYSERVYFDYIYSNLLLRLKDRLEQDEFAKSEAELRDFYEAHKTSYTKMDVFKLQVVAIKNADRQSAVAALERLKKYWQSGDDVETLIKRLREESDLDVQLRTEVLNEETRSYSEEDPYFERVIALNTGGFSEVFYNFEEFVVLKCLERKPGGLRSFEEMKATVRRQYTDQLYDKLVARLIEEAEVKINNRSYDRMPIRE